MLQQILQDMHVDPDVLEALNEEQKKILFLKMREEQVRRWKEREETLETDGGPVIKQKPKKGHSKNVSWLLGRDGDVHVCVIGEEEVHSSRLFLSQLAAQRPCELPNHTIRQTTVRSNLGHQISSEPAQNEKENIPTKEFTGIQLHLRENMRDLKLAPHSPPLQEECGTAAVQQHHDVSLTKPDSSPAVEPEEEEEPEDDSSSSGEDINDAIFSYRPHIQLTKTTSIAERIQPPSSQPKKADSLSISNRLHPLTLQYQVNSPSTADSLRPQDSQVKNKGKDTHVVTAPHGESTGQPGDGSKEPVLVPGRVAELMKTFSRPSSQSTISPNKNASVRIKPPLPSKPLHLISSPGHR